MAARSNYMSNYMENYMLKEKRFCKILKKILEDFEP